MSLITIRRGVRAALLSLSVTFTATACSDATAPEAAAPAFDQVSASADGHARRPLRIWGTVALVSPIIPTPAPCFQAANSELAGIASHMGRFEGTGSTCILTNLATVTPDPDPPFTPAGPPPYVTAQFTNPLWVLTAANGDELWLQALDAVAVISGVDGSLRAEGTHTIVGGTGRFTGATGELRTMARNDDGLGPDDFRSEGWVVY